MHACDVTVGVLYAVKYASKLCHIS